MSGCCSHNVAMTAEVRRSYREKTPLTPGRHRQVDDLKFQKTNDSGTVLRQYGDVTQADVWSDPRELTCCISGILTTQLRTECLHGAKEKALVTLVFDIPKPKQAFVRIPSQNVCLELGSLTARYIHGVIFLLTTIIAWMVRDYSYRALNGLHALNGCHGEHNCLGTEGVLRISLGCFTFFFTMYLTTVGTKDINDPRDSWHSGWWPLKSLMWMFTIVLPFVLPSAFIQVYGEMARFGAGIFLVIQLLSVINFVFWWNDKWLSEKNVRRLQWAIVAVSVLAYASSLGGLIIMYIWFAPAASCSLNIFFITWTLILILVFTIISLHSRVNAGLLTSGVVALYVVFLCWSAIMSEPAAVTCNTRHRQAGHADWTTIVSFLLAFSAIIMSTFSTGIDSKSFSMKSEDGQPNDNVPYGYGYFHFVFAMGAMYFAMLFVGWNLHQTAHKWSIDVGWASVWVKIVNEWLTALVYSWCMVGPFILRDREF